jgi:hypothetical protein
MCKFKRLNLCTRGESCTYAHNQSELQPLPNLYKTKMCFEMSKNKACTNPSCPYAHTKIELRTIAYKNSMEMEAKQHRQEVRQANQFGAQPYWYAPSNSPWTREGNALPQFPQPLMNGFDDSPKSTGPVEDFFPVKADAAPILMASNSKHDDSTICDSSYSYGGSEFSEPEEMLGETPTVPPTMTWTVKNTFLELSPTVADQTFVSSRMFRSRSSPVFI